MNKYIDAEKLKAEIERQKVPFKKDIEDDVYPTYLCALMDFEDLITSLQQDQDLIIINKKDWEAQEQFRKNKDFGKPLQQEQRVDFKIEERKWVHDAVDNIFPEDGDFMSEVDFRKILKDTAHHFYELGLKAREE